MKKNKTQEYAILWLHSIKKNNADIAEELGIGVEKVEAVIRVNSEPKAAKSNRSKSQSLMITETSNKKNNSVAIMTQEASSLNDEMKKKFRGKRADTQGFIFKPNER